MSSVLDPSALAESPLADLHVLANELGVDGFRRLRKDDLIDAIIARQSGEEPPAVATSDGDDDDTDARPKRSRSRGGRSRSRTVKDADDGADDDADEDKPARGRSRGRGTDADSGDDDKPSRGRGRGRGADPDSGDDEKPARNRGRGRGGDKPEASAEDKEIEGVVELLGNGSAFVRLNPPESGDEDAYVSAAQVKRCELVSGDKVSGPVRPPRRSERFPSLVRIDSINGRPADEVAEGTRFEDLPAAFPAERLALGSEDPTVKALEWLTPFGKGSRVVISGPARAGKTEALRRIAAALVGQDGLELTLVLAGVRPEEVADWNELGVTPAAAVTFAASGEAQAQAVESAVEQGRRVAARGADAVVLIDSLDGLSPANARRALAAARNITDGGSLTVLATAALPVGGETTVIALDATLTAMRRFPALDLASSGTMRPELLVGDAGAEAIAAARAEVA